MLGLSSKHVNLFRNESTCLLYSSVIINQLTLSSDRLKQQSYAEDYTPQINKTKISISLFNQAQSRPTFLPVSLTLYYPLLTIFPKSPGYTALYNYYNYSVIILNNLNINLFYPAAKQYRRVFWHVFCKYLLANSNCLSVATFAHLHIKK